jgi:hypothetical protein
MIAANDNVVLMSNWYKIQTATILFKALTQSNN